MIFGYEHESQHQQTTVPSEANLAMTIVQPQDELLENPSCLHLCQLAKGIGTKCVSKQVTSLSKLHANSKVLSGKKHLQAHSK